MPRTAESIAGKLVEVCCQGRRSRSRDRISPFSMPATAGRVLDVYQQVLEG
ncbi:MAG: hypothetical protein ACRD3O_08430 [Terriglobia bacterium]